MPIVDFNSGKGKAMHWIETHPNKYFSTHDLSRMLSCKPHCVKAAIAQMRKDGWNITNTGIHGSLTSWMNHGKN